MLAERFQIISIDEFAKAVMKAKNGKPRVLASFEDSCQPRRRLKNAKVQTKNYPRLSPVFLKVGKKVNGRSFGRAFRRR